MASSKQNYVIAPWGNDDCDTTVLTVELPSRDCVAQIEVPTDLVDRVDRLADRHDIPVEQTLAERLELNRARVAVATARALEDVSAIREQLTTAKISLYGVETLDTSDVESDIQRIWARELESS